MLGDAVRRHITQRVRCCGLRSYCAAVLFVAASHDECAVLFCGVVLCCAVSGAAVLYCIAWRASVDLEGAWEGLMWGTFEVKGKTMTHTTACL